jgi:soluble lytic murein transglycosylase-like protein
VNVTQAIIAEAQQQGVSPALALEVAIQESGLNQSRIGADGEVGIFQLLPATARDLGVNPAILEQNIRGGILYLRQQLAAFGDAGKALAAYNCGPGCVAAAIRDYGAEWTRGIPSSTRSYISAILGRLQSEYAVSLPGGGIVANVLAPAPDETQQQRWKRLALYAAAGLLFYLVVDELLP